MENKLDIKIYWSECYEAYLLVINGQEMQTAEHPSEFADTLTQWMAAE